jgi:hypothetical protein
MPIEYSELTKKYVEALMREGDDFNPLEWFNEVIAEKRRLESENTHAPEQLSNPTFRTVTSIVQPASAAALPQAPITRPDTAHSRHSNRLRRRLSELSDIWEGVREDRRRDAIYHFLQAVFDVVISYKSKRRRKRLLRRAFKFAGLPFDPYVDPFAAVIRCTTDGEADRKMISKWSRALRFAAIAKKPRVPLKRFMKRMGGINGAADQYTRFVRRQVSRT